MSNAQIEAPTLQAAPQTQEAPIYALVGNPNSGKTTLFNALTGMRQKVANYAGVTVERKIGRFVSQHGKEIPVIDLPGAYSLNVHAPDEAILRNVLLGLIHEEIEPNRILCVADASNLKRHLYLAIQAAELGMPMILVLNREDLALEKGMHIETARLEEALGIPVVLSQAHKQRGLIPVKLAISRPRLNAPRPLIEYPAFIERHLASLAESLVTQEDAAMPQARGMALLLLQEGSCEICVSGKTRALLESIKQELHNEDPNWQSYLIQERYKIIEDLYRESVSIRPPGKKTLTERLDQVLLHPVWGWCSLAAIMGLLFWSIFSLAGYPISAIQWAFDGVSESINGVFPRGPLRDLVNDGMLTGISNILMFLPQILILFLFIGILESTGYLPRAAFLLDRLMSRVGLQGKSFIPLLSSFACAVPGIMATRTLKSREERLATILVAPWMSCSARLPVYLLLIGAILPNHSAWAKAGILLGAYVLGIAGAFCAAFCVRKTLLKGRSSDSVMELPPYTWPSWRNLLVYLGDRARVFVRRVGTTILALSIIMWFLTAYPGKAEESAAAHIEASYAGMIGQTLEPLIKPLGYDWKVGIGLVSAFASREVFVSTLAIVYSAEDPSGGAGCCCGCGGVPKNRALASIIPQQTWPDGSPIFTPLSCLSLIVFFIFALQCVSTLAIVRQETGSWTMPLLQLVLMTGFAYLAALTLYQGGKLLGFA